MLEENAVVSQIPGELQVIFKCYTNDFAEGNNLTLKEEQVSKRAFVTIEIVTHSHSALLDLLHDVIRT